ncbi:hypothetical protein NQ317_001293 [Molorchus minor]|uniref:Leucine-rich repeat-containing protein 47 n=1 Tax=Molorchus minor TaxID=1323400 RepID=A0ABQ9JNH9_9CUCU|nr:hypothetical protein NQ317_001293 [Molorchus minor]
MFEGLANLSELKLHGNEIEDIPNNISMLPALKVFDISSNKVETIPGELSDCHKLKELNLKSNPISDRRLLKLIDHKKDRNKSNSEAEEDTNSVEYKFILNVTHAPENFKVLIMNSVKSVREHLVACIIQNKLHDTVCEKRNVATIATHDFNKFPPGNLIYTTCPPKELMIVPLNRGTSMSGAQLFSRLQIEANNLRKERKRNTYSGIHKYLYLIEGKPLYPCLLNDKKEVISFPPITNSDISKIEIGTTKIFIEVTSSVSQFVCKNVLDTLIKEMVFLFEKDLDVLQVKTVDHEEHLKTVYPAKTDLIFDKSVPIKISRE